MKNRKTILLLLIASISSLIQFGLAVSFNQVEGKFLAQVLILNAAFSILFAITAYYISSKIIPGLFYLIVSNIKLLFLALALLLVFNKQYEITNWYVIHFMLSYFIWVIVEILYYFNLLKIKTF